MRQSLDRGKGPPTFCSDDVVYSFSTARYSLSYKFAWQCNWAVTCLLEQDVRSYHGILVVDGVIPLLVLVWLLVPFMLG